MGHMDQALPSLPGTTRRSALKAQMMSNSLQKLARWCCAKAGSIAWLYTPELLSPGKTGR